MFNDLLTALINPTRYFVEGADYSYWMLFLSVVGSLSGMLFCSLSHLKKGAALQRNRARVQVLVLMCLVIETAGYLRPYSDFFNCAAALSVPLAFCIAGFGVLELFL